MKIKDALKRIEELERKISELEARPMIVHHNHYHTYPNPNLYQIPLPTMLPNTYPIMCEAQKMTWGGGSS